jgi:hypothetical protein
MVRTGLCDALAIRRLASPTAAAIEPALKILVKNDILFLISHKTAWSETNARVTTAARRATSTGSIYQGSLPSLKQCK